MLIVGIKLLSGVGDTGSTSVSVSGTRVDLDVTWSWDVTCSVLACEIFASCLVVFAKF